MREKPALTTGQRNVLEVIIEHLKAHDYSPTVREIGAALGFRSATGAVYHLHRLKAKGYITWDPDRSRTIRLTGSPKPAELPMAGLVPAGPPSLAEECDDTVDFSDLFSPGNAALRVADDALDAACIKRGDYLVRGDGGRCVAIIRRV